MHATLPGPGLPLQPAAHGRRLTAAAGASSWPAGLCRDWLGPPGRARSASSCTSCWPAAAGAQAGGQGIMQEMVGHRHTPPPAGTSREREGAQRAATHRGNCMQPLTSLAMRFTPTMLMAGPNSHMPGLSLPVLGSGGSIAPELQAGRGSTSGTGGGRWWASLCLPAKHGAAAAAVAAGGGAARSAEHPPTPSEPAKPPTCGCSSKWCPFVCWGQR